LEGAFCLFAPPDFLPELAVGGLEFLLLSQHGLSQPVVFQMRAHPGQDLIRLERTRDVVHAATGEALEQSLRLIFGGEEDDRDGADVLEALQFAAGGESVGAGHDDIQEHEIRVGPLGDLDSGGAVGGQQHFVAARFKDFAQKIAVGRDVVHDQDGTGTGGGRVGRHGSASWVVMGIRFKKA
jgi:hypothetical protein